MDFASMTSSSTTPSASQRKQAGIEIRDLVVGYGTQPVIDRLSLTIENGALFTLLGPSGCGKTTLLRTIAGFIPVRSGSLRFGARDVTALPAHQRDIGIVFQDYALFPDKSVFDNVAYGLRARKKDAATIRATVGEYLERVGLSAFAERMPAALSGGQRQRVALARALAIKPTVLLMDEPLSNLDAKLRVQVRETIADLQREIGITTVFVTHDQEEALAMSDRIGLMRLGKLEQEVRPKISMQDRFRPMSETLSVRRIRLRRRWQTPKPLARQSQRRSAARKSTGSRRPIWMLARRL